MIAFLIATEDRLSAALIRYVIKSSARGAFDAGEIIDLAATRFGEVSAELIARKRKEWRRATMEVHYAKPPALLAEVRCVSGGRGGGWGMGQCSAVQCRCPIAAVGICM